jgi:hypothetical protein
MEEILSVLILFPFCWLISRWEKAKFRTYITPFATLAWPFSILVIAINLGGIHFGFFAVSLKSVLFVILCLLFFLMGGYSVVHAFKEHGDTVSRNLKSKESVLERYRPLFILLALVSILGGGVHFLRVIADLGWMNIGSREFKDTMGAGIFAHIVLLSRPSFIFLFADYIRMKRKYILVLLVMMLIIILTRLVKYHIVILILGGIYFSHMNGIMKFSWKKTAIYVGLIYLIFNVTYVVGFSTQGFQHAYSSKVQSYLLNHFFTYIFGGPIGLSKVLDKGVYPLYSYDEIFAVPLNLYRFMITKEEMVDIIYHKWIPVSSIHEYFHSTNTFSLFGMAYLFLGTFGTLIYMYIIGAVAYLFQHLSRQRGNNVGYSLIHAMNLGFLTISFFGLYFNILNFFEVWFYTLIIPIMYMIMRKYLIVPSKKDDILPIGEKRADE